MLKLKPILKTLLQASTSIWSENKSDWENSLWLSKQCKSWAPFSPENQSWEFLRKLDRKWSQFLADRTNGRAIGTLLRLSVCLSSSVTLCIAAKRSILEQKFLLTAYRKSYLWPRYA